MVMNHLTRPGSSVSSRCSPRASAYFTSPVTRPGPRYPCGEEERPGSLQHTGATRGHRPRPPGSGTGAPRFVRGPGSHQRQDAGCSRPACGV